MTLDEIYARMLASRDAGESEPEAINTHKAGLMGLLSDMRPDDVRWIGDALEDETRR
jgi:hypothetical protein